MGRKLRHQESGAYYHVVSRGNNKQPIFDDELRALFLRSLLRVSVAHEWRVLGYALMNNPHTFFHAQPAKARVALFDYVQDGRVRCQAPWDGPPSTRACIRGRSRLRAG